MSIHVEDGPDAAVEDAEPGTGSEDQSPRGRLRARHRELQNDHTRDIDVPGYGGDLVGRYRVLSPDQIREGNRKIEKLPEDERLVVGAIDQIIAACDSLWVRGDNGLEPLLPDDPEPARYDKRLAEFFGFEAERAREVVRQVFTTGGELNVPAVIAHAQEIGVWMQDVSREVDAAFLGE